jgi:hypothetical protein
MNLEKQITSYLRDRHAKMWFLQIREEFYTHYYYNKITGKIELDMEELEDVPIAFNENEEPIHFVKQLIVHNVEKTFRDYCWSTKTTDEYASELAGLRNTLNWLVKKLHETLGIAGTIQEKHQIITRARDIIKREIDLIQRDTDVVHNSLLNELFQRFRWKLNIDYSNIIWFIISQDTKKPATALPRNRKPDPINLKKEFFKDLFDQYDYSRTPIIKHHDLPNREKYVNFLYSFYKGLPTAAVEINFNWNKAPIYYMLNKIFHTNTKKTLTDLEESKCIKIKDVFFSSQNCKKGASIFGNQQSSLKQIIDEIFPLVR